MGFNAITTGTSAAVSYLGKDRKPPEELLGCWPLAGGSLLDVSRYNGVNNIATINYTTTDSYGFPTITSNKTLYSFTLGKALRLSDDWSVDAHIKYVETRSEGDRLTVGGVVFRTSHSDYGTVLNLSYDTLSTYVRPVSVTGLLRHTALRYTSSDNYIRLYLDGEKVLELNANLSSAADCSTITYQGNGWGHVQGMSNFRVVQKALGSSSSYPTPSSLYTGFEPL